MSGGIPYARFVLLGFQQDGKDMMQTNLTIQRDSELEKRGKVLIEAGSEYWDEYQRVCGSSAVVWLEMDNGHFILFTRSEYKQDIMYRVPALQDEGGMVRPFEPNVSNEPS